LTQFRLENNQSETDILASGNQEFLAQSCTPLKAAPNHGYREDCSASLVRMKLTNKSTHAFTDKAGRATVGFCLWCDKNFYNPDEISVHNGDGAQACRAFTEFLSKQGIGFRSMKRERRKARVNETPWTRE
jgi:hypothetical protein